MDSPDRSSARGFAAGTPNQLRRQAQQMFDDCDKFSACMLEDVGLYRLG
ncbi:hypothetical protein [Bradyrhizobium sp. CCBAU 45384]|nr:hypothetical protein [Bradyrhizobium sp. CCBAU 45384]